jgi:hypothetical protein
MTEQQDTVAMVASAFFGTFARRRAVGRGGGRRARSLVFAPHRVQNRQQHRKADATRISVAQNIRPSVRRLDTPSQTVRLEFGEVEEGIRNGNIAASS